MKRPQHFEIRNLAGIQLSPEAQAEILHLEHCVAREYGFRHFYYFHTTQDYCVIDERAFDSLDALQQFMRQLNPDPGKTDVFADKAPEGKAPLRYIYFVRE